MVIAVDVDDTVCNTIDQWLKFYNQDYGDVLYTNQILSWDITKYVKPDCGRKIYDYLVPCLWDRALPVEGALAGVNALRAMGHRIIFATSTTKAAAGRKLQWLEQHGFLTLKYGCISPDYVEVSDKSLVRADWIIDDRVENLQTFEGGKLLFDQPWNREAELLHRACSWKQVVGYFRF